MTIVYKVHPLCCPLQHPCHTAFLSDCLKEIIDSRHRLTLRSPVACAVQETPAPTPRAEECISQPQGTEHRSTFDNFYNLTPRCSLQPTPSAHRRWFLQGLASCEYGCCSGCPWLRWESAGRNAFCLDWNPPPSFAFSSMRGPRLKRGWKGLNVSKGFGDTGLLGGERVVISGVKEWKAHVPPLPVHTEWLRNEGKRGWGKTVLSFVEPTLEKCSKALSKSKAEPCPSTSVGNSALEAGSPGAAKSPSLHPTLGFPLPTPLPCYSLFHKQINTIYWVCLVSHVHIWFSGWALGIGKNN